MFALYAKHEINTKLIFLSTNIKKISRGLITTPGYINYIFTIMKYKLQIYFNLSSATLTVFLSFSYSAISSLYRFSGSL